MWKLRIGVLVIGGMLLLAPGAGAASGANSGDVWLDNVKQPAGPGHEMDPHLACQDIDLWGAGLADSSGTFTLDGWSPSGSQELDYSGTWSYAPGGDRTIAVISVSRLIAQAEANGDAGSPQGFHFKLEFSQDPQKRKTFWVDCPGSSTGGGGSNTGGGGSNTGGGGSNTGGGGSNTGGGSPPAGGTTDRNTPSGGAGTRPATGSSGGPVFRSIGAITARRPRHPTHKRHRLVHPAPHRRAHRRHVKAARVGTPPFTG